MSAMCPRCGVMLSKKEYEGESVSCCDTCWGYWLTRISLDNIIKKTEYLFNETEVKNITNTFFIEGDRDRSGSEGKDIACPVCAKTLERKKYHPRCAVMIDECKDHGIWLDTGEIKDLQVFVAKFFKG